MMNHFKKYDKLSKPNLHFYYPNLCFKQFFKHFSPQTGAKNHNVSVNTPKCKDLRGVIFLNSFNLKSRCQRKSLKLNQMPASIPEGYTTTKSSLTSCQPIPLWHPKTYIKVSIEGLLRESSFGFAFKTLIAYNFETYIGGRDVKLHRITEVLDDKNTKSFVFQLVRHRVVTFFGIFPYSFYIYIFIPLYPPYPPYLSVLLFIFIYKVEKSNDVRNTLFENQRLSLCEDDKHQGLKKSRCKLNYLNVKTLISKEDNKHFCDSVKLRITTPCVFSIKIKSCSNENRRETFGVAL